MSTPPVTGYVGWYTGTGWTSTGWTNIASSGTTSNISIFSSNSSNIFTTIDPETNLSYVYGGTAANMTFPFTLTSSSDYTFFHVARYNGYTRKRIFSSANNTGNNWLSGFRSGFGGVAYHEGWLTPFTNSMADSHMWIISSDRRTNYRANGSNVTTGGTNLVAPIQITVNTGIASDELSDWAIGEMIFYTSTLSDADVIKVEDYLMSKWVLSYPSGSLRGELRIKTLLEKLYNKTVNTATNVQVLYRDNGIVTTNQTQMPALGSELTISKARGLYRNPLLFKLSAAYVNQRVGFNTVAVNSTTTSSNLATVPDEIGKFSATATNTPTIVYDTTFMYPYFYFNGTGNQHLVLPTLNFKFQDKDGNNIQGMTVVTVAQFDDAGHWARLFDFSNGAENNNILWARHSTNSNLLVDLRNGSTIVAQITSPANSLDTKLHIWTVVVENTNMTLKMYKDGSEVSSSSYTNKIDNKTLNMGVNYIGRSPWTVDAYFKGRIAEFDCYSLPLTSTELDRVHSSYLKRFGKVISPVGNLKLWLDATNTNSYSGSSATSFKDLCGSSNDFSLPTSGHSYDSTLGCMTITSNILSMGPSNNNFNIGANYTFEVLCRPSRNTVNTTFVNFLNTPGGRLLNIHMPWSDGFVYFDVLATSTGNTYNRLHYQATNVTTKKHYVFRCRSSESPYLQVFENGVSVAQRISSLNTTFGANGGSSYLFSEYVSTTEQTSHWQGDVYYIKFYDKALTDTEIKLAYSVSLGY